MGRLPVKFIDVFDWQISRNRNWDWTARIRARKWAKKYNGQFSHSSFLCIHSKRIYELVNAEMHLALATHEIRFSGRLGIEHYKTGMAFQDVIDGPFKNDVPS